MNNKHFKKEQSTLYNELAAFLLFEYTIIVKPADEFILTKMKKVNEIPIPVCSIEKRDIQYRKTKLQEISKSTGILKFHWKF